MNNWFIGLEAVLSWFPLLCMMIGVAAGIVIGAIPGLSATMGIAILLPFTFVMDPLPGMMMLLGLYSGAIYAGSVPAILLNLPGTPASAATTLDGYPLTKQGRGGQALMISLVFTAVGALVGGILLAVFAPFLATVALAMGAAEYFMLAVFALTIIGAMSEGSMVKGLIGGVLGLLLATVGTDPIDGYSRFTFGASELRGGIGFIPVLIGLFGVGEALRQMERRSELGNVKRISLGKFSLGGLGRKLTPGALYSSFLGFLVGVLPGTGGEVGSFVGHNEVRRVSRNTEDFGRGDPRGLAAAEAANSASVPGTIAPTLVLGIPGNAAAAVLIGAITVHGLRPGPQLFTGAPELVYGIFITLTLIPFVMFGMGFLGIRGWGRLATIPTQYLWPVVLGLSALGSFAVRNNVFDVLVMAGAGVAGYFMIINKFPIAPLVIGLIVGPIAESNLRRAVILDGGGYGWLFEPIPFALLCLSVLTLAMPIMRSMRKKKEKTSTSAVIG